VVAKAEETTSRLLRSVLSSIPDGGTIEDSDEFLDLQSALELFLPVVLRERYPNEWRGESLDGFRLAVARKVGPAEAELIGLCLLISDQTWTPVHVRLRSGSSGTSIPWVRCKLGTRDSSGLTRLPYESSKVSKLLYTVSERPESLNWMYSVERTHSEIAG
jgi:hypothetical protein